MSEPLPETDAELKVLLNKETSKIPWSELQRFFASGMVVQVESSMDLLDVACHIARDNKPQLDVWMSSGQVGKVSDEQASSWLEEDLTVWAVVLAPWVLVQTVSQDKPS